MHQAEGPFYVTHRLANLTTIPTSSTMCSCLERMFYRKDPQMSVRTILKDEVGDILVALCITADAAAAMHADAHAESFLRGYHTALSSVASAMGLRPLTPTTGREPTPTTHVALPFRATPADRAQR